MKELFTTLYRYGEWANARLLAKARALTPAQLGERVFKGAEAILPTFGHLVGADLRWLHRWQGETPPTVAVADFTSLDVVQRRWDEVCASRRAYLQSLDETALLATIRWSRDSGPVDLPRWHALMQCANHGTQHRAELAAMLTDFGQSPGDLDFMVFSLEQIGIRG